MKNSNNIKIILIIVGIIILILSLLLNLDKDKKNIEVLEITKSKTTMKESCYVDIKGNIKKPGVYKMKKNQTINDLIKSAGGLKNNSYTDNINLSKIVTDEMVIYIHSKKELNNIKKINNCICKPKYKYIDCTNETTSVTTTTTKPITTIQTSPTTTQYMEITESTTQKNSNITTTTTSLIEENTKQTTTPTTKKIIVNINTGTLEELLTIKGLGETKANNIIEYRNNNGLFNSIEELLKVNGIGKKTLENIKDYIEI